MNIGQCFIGAGVEIDLYEVWHSPLVYEIL